jgi:hypothetical protein
MKKQTTRSKIAGVRRARREQAKKTRKARQHIAWGQFLNTGRSHNWAIPLGFERLTADNLSSRQKEAVVRWFKDHGNDAPLKARSGRKVPLHKVRHGQARIRIRKAG